VVGLNLLAIFVFIPDDDFTPPGIDQNIRWLGKARSALDVVVADELEIISLPKYSSFIVN
jgi:hypothetical protein